MRNFRHNCLPPQLAISPNVDTDDGIEAVAYAGNYPSLRSCREMWQYHADS